MIETQFLYQGHQFREIVGCREQHELFRHEMNTDFSLKLLRDFRLPSRKIRVPDGQCAIDTNTQGQGVLVLARERD